MAPTKTVQMDTSEASNSSSKISLTRKAISSQTGSDFLGRNDLIEEGDTVMIYVNFGAICAVRVTRGCTLNMKYGALRHEFLIGKRYGSRISATAGYVYALRPTAELWTRSLPRRTQILYTPDCSLILMLLDVKPGSVICESGTGSGSLSHALASALAPSGHLYTHDIEESRVKQVEEEFKAHGLGEVTTCVLQNVCEDGFFVENSCDGVFLDLPAPWLAIEHAKHALSRARGGRIVSFSPCIEQVQRTCETLRRQGFVQVDTVELVARKLKVIDLMNETLEQLNMSKYSVTEEEKPTATDEEISPANKKRKLERGCEAHSAHSGQTMVAFPPSQPTHTGYLTSATLLPSATVKG